MRSSNGSMPWKQPAFGNRKDLPKLQSLLSLVPDLPQGQLRETCPIPGKWGLFRSRNSVPLKCWEDLQEFCTGSPCSAPLRVRGSGRKNVGSYGSTPV